MRAMTGNSSKFRAKAAISIDVGQPSLAVRIAQTWLLFGAVALLCVPSLRESSEWIGWLPFWLFVAPLANLLVLRWRSLLDVSRKGFSRLRRRRIAPVIRTSRRAVKTRQYRPRAQGPTRSLLSALLIK